MNSPERHPGNLNKIPNPSAITTHKPTEDLARARTKVLTGWLDAGVSRGRPAAMGWDGMWGLPEVPHEAGSCLGSSSGLIRRLPSSNRPRRSKWGPSGVLCGNCPDLPAQTPQTQTFA